VGQKRLTKALERYPSSVVTWKPFQIDPNTALQGESMEGYCRRRWGGSGWTVHLKQEGAKDGATFSNWSWWPNTLKGHRFVAFAETKGVDSDTANKVIFDALYERGENISLVPTLARIGENLGLNGEELRKYLESDAGEDEVLREMERGRRKYGISGVPFFVISKEGHGGRPYGLSGAQTPRAFIQVFEELSKE